MLNFWNIQRIYLLLITLWKCPIHACDMSKLCTMPPPLPPCHFHNKINLKNLWLIWHSFPLMSRGGWAPPLRAPSLYTDIQYWIICALITTKCHECVHLCFHVFVVHRFKIANVLDSHDHTSSQISIVICHISNSSSMKVTWILKREIYMIPSFKIIVQNPLTA